MEIRLTVNELSKIVGVSSRTIRYYDEIGLLPCSGLMENGYRYYTIEKIEEINMIHYMRKMGIPIREIKAHLEKRAFESYDGLLRNHLEKVEEEIENLKGIRRQLKRRVEALDHVKDLPPIGRIHVQHLQARRVVMEEKRIQAQLDWEKALQRLVVENGLAHGVYVGDLGFLVDLKQVEDRAAEDFVGVYILTGFQGKEGATEESAFPAGDWLTLYVRGGHSQAKKHYKQLLAYAEDHGMVLGPYATERMLIDHYISHDENDHVTEIMIPMDLG